MPQALKFGDVLDAADQLSSEEQEALVDILHRRMLERGRQRLALEIQEANREFAAGKCKAVTPEELAKEILS